MQKSKENAKKAKDIIDVLQNQGEDEKKDFLKWSKIDANEYEKMMKIECLNFAVCYNRYYGAMKLYSKETANSLIFLKNIVKFGFLEEMYFPFAMEAWNVTPKFMRVHHKNYKQASYCLEAAISVLKKYSNTDGVFDERDHDLIHSAIKFQYVVHFISLLQELDCMDQPKLTKIDGMTFHEISPKFYEPPKNHAESMKLLEFAKKILTDASKFEYRDNEMETFAALKLVAGEAHLKRKNKYGDNDFFG